METKKCIECGKMLRSNNKTLLCATHYKKKYQKKYWKEKMEKEFNREEALEKKAEIEHHLFVEDDILAENNSEFIKIANNSPEQSRRVADD